MCTSCVCADDLLRLLNEFYRRTAVRRLAAESGLDGEHDLITNTLVAAITVIFLYK